MSRNHLGLNPRSGPSTPADRHSGVVCWEGGAQPRSVFIPSKTLKAPFNLEKGDVSTNTYTTHTFRSKAP